MILISERFHIKDFQQIDVHLDKEKDEICLVRVLIDFEMDLKNWVCGMGISSVSADEGVCEWQRA